MESTVLYILWYRMKSIIKVRFIFWLFPYAGAWSLPGGFKPYVKFHMCTRYNCHTQYIQWFKFNYFKLQLEYCFIWLRSFLNVWCTWNKLIFFLFIKWYWIYLFGKSVTFKYKPVFSLEDSCQLQLHRYSAITIALKFTEINRRTAVSHFELVGLGFVHFENWYKIIFYQSGATLTTFKLKTMVVYFCHIYFEIAYRWQFNALYFFRYLSYWI